MARQHRTSRGRGGQGRQGERGSVAGSSEQRATARLPCRNRESGNATSSRDHNAERIKGSRPVESVGDLQELGLWCVGFYPNRQRVADSTNIRRFRAHFGVDPTGLFKMLEDLRSAENVEPKHLLMSMHFLKCYPTEECMAGIWDMDEDSVRKWVKCYVQRIAGEKDRKIAWGEFGADVFILTVDGVHCRIQEPRTDPGPHNYSHKSNSAGLAYEVGIAIWQNRCVWVAGPFDASVHDLTIFRGGKKLAPKDPSALWAKIPDGKKAIADSGYVGESDVGGKISVSRDEDSKSLRDFKNKAKGRHESFNRRLKAFNVLDQAFRGGKDGKDRKLQHKVMFEAVAVAVQYDLENGHPLMEMNLSVSD